MQKKLMQNVISITLLLVMSINFSNYKFYAAIPSNLQQQIYLPSSFSSMPYYTPLFIFYVIIEGIQSQWEGKNSHLQQITAQKYPPKLQTYKQLRYSREVNIIHKYVYNKTISVEYYVWLQVIEFDFLFWVCAFCCSSFQGGIGNVISLIKYLRKIFMFQVLHRIYTAMIIYQCLMINEFFRPSLFK